MSIARYEVVMTSQALATNDVSVTTSFFASITHISAIHYYYTRLTLIKPPDRFYPDRYYRPINRLGGLLWITERSCRCGRCRPLKSHRALNLIIKRQLTTLKTHLYCKDAADQQYVFTVAVPRVADEFELISNSAHPRSQP